MKSIFIILLLTSYFYSTPSQKAPVTKVEWKIKDFNAGQIYQGKPLKVAFEFTNTGKLPLLITNVETSCGCTAAKYPKKPIAPGMTEKIVVRYDALDMGSFHKTLKVYYNAEDEIALLNLRGEVIP